MTHEAHAQAADVADQLQDQQMAYAIRMRKLFSPSDMLNSDGSINQEFFRPKKVLTLTDKKWGDAEREQLYKGLHKYGVGNWRDIGAQMLPGWDDHSIRIKAAKLLGCQNISRYYGRHFSKGEAQEEFEKNKQLGAETGCWKNGMLVDDDNGTLKVHFQAAAAAAAAATGGTKIPATQADGTARHAVAGACCSAAAAAAGGAGGGGADSNSADQQLNDSGHQHATDM